MRPGTPKTERDQERIILSLERIADLLQAINNNLAVVAKAMTDSSDDPASLRASRTPR
jgi:hypothetical protein